nr:uncharacterized protein CTRU02_15858 [Colletotrichum truncatum]XP_036576207.1 uncharacterized protein CTRU02_13894 [Colletotrichum truncatum]KAF6780575.1 hypothetical protein CTRU02_15858 [Colletotrichum truncatum]KAF6782896.1 hypothetical protein CTRU02_13894 [Colletotrichum truncatum]
MKLFGGLVAWRANKQATVTTSTTEAELLSLSQAAKEALFASRLISALNVHLPTEEAPEATFPAEKRSTVRLGTTDLVTLQTRLRHVDIHNYWLRQEVAAKRVSVAYTPSSELMADGLTKSLALPQFREFRKQVRMSEQAELLKRNRRRELEEDEEAWAKRAAQEDVWAVEDHEKRAPSATGSS